MGFDHGEGNVLNTDNSCLPDRPTGPPLEFTAFDLVDVAPPPPRQLAPIHSPRIPIDVRSIEELFPKDYGLSWMNIFWLAIFLPVPVSMIVFGGMYWDRAMYCPHAENVAGLLISGGVIHLLIWVCLAVAIYRSTTGHKTAYLTGLCIAKLFCWLVAAAVIIYRSHGDVSYNSESPNYCNPALYRMTFWMLTVHWGLIILTFLFVLIFVVCIFVS